MMHYVRQIDQIDFGLIIFLGVIAVNVLGLFLDFALLYFGFWTVTQWVWKYPLVGVPILAWQVLGVVGIALHFYYFRLDP